MYVVSLVQINSKMHIWHKYLTILFFIEYFVDKFTVRAWSQNKFLAHMYYLYGNNMLNLNLRLKFLQL